MGDDWGIIINGCGVMVENGGVVIFKNNGLTSNGHMLHYRAKE